MHHPRESETEKMVTTGKPAPDFQLVDTQDAIIKLSDFKGKKHVVLVLSRSFFCPFCRRHLAKLSHDYPEFQKRNAEVLVLGPGNLETFKRVWKMEGYSMIGLSDSDSKVSDLYKQEVNLLKLGRMPALAVIDKQGILQFIHYASSMSDIPENSAIFEILEKLN